MIRTNGRRAAGRAHRGLTSPSAAQPAPPRPSRPNGAGKTTTMRMLGLSQPEQRPRRDLGRTLPRPAEPGPARRHPSRRVRQHAGARGRGGAVLRPHHGRAGAARRRAAGARRPRRNGGPAACSASSARHAPAPGLRPRTARRPRGPDPRRAGDGLDPEGSCAGCRACSSTSPTAGGTVLLSSHLSAEIEAVADRMIDHRRRTDPGAGHRPLLGTSRDRRAQPAALDTALHSAACDQPDRRRSAAGRPSRGRRPRGDGPRRRAAPPRPAEDAGLERLFFELTTGRRKPAVTETDRSIRELAGSRISPTTSPHRSAWTPPASTRAPASAASSPSSFAGSTRAGSRYRSPWWR